MERNLEEMRKVLWDAFEDAAKKHTSYKDSEYAYASAPENYKVQNRIALGSLAQAILAVDARISEQEESKQDFKGLGR